MNKDDQLFLYIELPTFEYSVIFHEKVDNFYYRVLI